MVRGGLRWATRLPRATNEGSGVHAQITLSDTDRKSNLLSATQTRDSEREIDVDRAPVEWFFPAKAGGLGPPILDRLI